jgi:hypothetical protein
LLPKETQTAFLVFSRRSKAAVQYVSLDGGGATRSFLHTTFSPRWGFQLGIHWLSSVGFQQKSRWWFQSFVFLQLFWAYKINRGVSFQIALFSSRIFGTSAMVSGEDLQILRGYGWLLAASFNDRVFASSLPPES